MQEDATNAFPLFSVLILCLKRGSGVEDQNLLLNLLLCPHSLMHSALPPSSSLEQKFLTQSELPILPLTLQCFRKMLGLRKAVF